jgi:conjugative relaxase-like TrwC/TraI family protein
VLSLGKLVPGRAQYYLESVANGVEDYYMAGKEAPGEWLGVSAERLGLAGMVAPEALLRVLEHEHPQSGDRLTRGHSVPSVLGYDATFCAPKSVSLLFGLGDPETSNEVRNAHDAAVAKALAVYEEVAQGRRGAGGVETVAGEGFVAAGFRHRTSRALDPHLHTHVVIANLVHAEADGRWSALDGRPIYQWCRTVGHLYDAQLRWELTRRLGVEWMPVRNGLADIAGVAAPVVRAFSTRRRQIEAALEISGQSGARASQGAAYATRAAKDDQVDAGELFAQWRARAEALGFDDRALAGMLGRVPDQVPIRPGSAEARALFVELAGPGGLTAQHASFGRGAVIEAVCDRLPVGGEIDDILNLADEFLASDLVVGLGAGDGAGLRRNNGQLLPSGQRVERFTTPEMIEVEQRVVATVARRVNDGAGVARVDAVDAALVERPTMSGEQAAMVTAMCGSGAGVELVEGVAGSGKTYALAAAREAWVGSGFAVSGVCLAAQAAQRLEEGAGIPSTTLHAFLVRVPRTRLCHRDVIVVDEAAMIGTRRLEQLLTHAERAGAKVVLVGDPRQLPEIDAGGAFAGLAARVGASQLSENRRQNEPWEREALAQLRHGNPDTALDAYLGHGRIHLADTVEELRTLMVDAWFAAAERGESALMTAPTRREVDELNQLVRTRLAARGRLVGDGIWLGERHYAVGDRVMALRNDRPIGVLNGTKAVLTSIDHDRRQLLVWTDHHPAYLPFDYAEQSLTHAYATTGHKAQGATVDRFVGLAGGSVSREMLYTLMSRGRLSNDLYATTTDWRHELRHQLEPEPEPLDTLTRAAHRRGAKHMAIDSGSRDRFVPREDLEAERAQLQRSLARKPRDPTSDLRRVEAKIADRRAELEGLTQERDAVAKQIESLGPVAKRLHRSGWRRIESTVEQLDRRIHDTRETIEGLGRNVRLLVHQRDKLGHWEQQHEPEIARLEELDDLLHTTRGRSGPELRRLTRQGPPQRPTPDIGIGL